MCPIYKSVTLETDDAVLCDGQCCTWYHKQCLGMMQDHYDKITEQVLGYEEWICPFCETDLSSFNDIGYALQGIFAMMPRHSTEL